MTKKIRVLLADDYPVTRAGIRAILEKAPDIQIVGEAQDGVEAQRLVAELCLRILLLDLVMPGPRAREIEAWVRAHYPETITLVLTGHDRDDYLAEMTGSGAVGFITEAEAPHRLVEAIQRAAQGEILFSKKQYARVRCWREEVGVRWARLTGRERDVLALLVEGKMNKEIARSLQIKTRTVENHVSSILDKLEMTSRTEAAVWVVREGLLDQDDT